LGLFSIHQARRHGVPIHRSSWGEVRQTLWAAKWELVLPLLVLIGIYGGFITVSEAAMVTAAYSLVITIVVHRDLHLWHDLPRLMTQSMVLVGAILIILGMALGFTSYLIDAQVPMHILAAMQRYITGRIVFLLVLNVLLLIVGCLMDIFSAIIVVIPLITPVAAQFGIHPLHLGIIVLTNLEIGYLTPPVGLNLFLGSLCFGRSMTQLYRASWPFLLVLLLALCLITYLPDLSLGLVRLFGYADAPIFRR
jgi:C4-dicarboxylate transporter DctM subunit